MALYRKVIPKIARDVIRTLLSKNAIEVDDARIAEAELDVAAVLVGHLDQVEAVGHEAKEALQRRGLSMDKFNQTKARFAEMKGIKIGEEEPDYLTGQILEALFASKNIEEIYFEDKDMRKLIKESLFKAISVSQDIEQEAKSRLKNIKEGTLEWDIEFPRMVSAIKRQKGLE